MNLDLFQEAGASFLHLAPGKGALLADEPGLGKTRQAIAAVKKTLLDRCLPRSVGVICPASAKPVWRRETQAFAPDVVWHIFSYEKCQLLDQFSLSVLVVDEAHKLKTRDSARTQKVFGEKCDGVGGLVAKADRVFLLTGTPTPNNPAEIWPMARACFPEAIVGKAGRPMLYWQFVSRYCKVKQDWLGHFKITGGKHIAELRTALAPHVLRRLKTDVLADLPEARHSVLPVEGKFPDGVPSEELIRAKAALAKGGLDALRKEAPHIATLRRLTGMAKVDGVARWIEDWLEDGGGKLVVFAYHVDVLRALHNHLHGAGVKLVAGGPGSDLLFQEDPSIQVFLGQIERDGVAITLTAASTVLLAEQSWVPSDNGQAWQRIHRRGQTRGCQVFYAALPGSVDDDIASALVAKQATIDKLWNSAA